LAHMPDDPATALRTYSAVRRARPWKVQPLAARNGARYHLTGPPAVLRNIVMHSLGGGWLLRHYDWLYNWRPPRAMSLS